MVTPSPRTITGAVNSGPCRAKCNHRFLVIVSASLTLLSMARLLTRAVPALAVAGLSSRYDLHPGHRIRSTAPASHGSGLPGNRDRRRRRGRRPGSVAALGRAGALDDRRPARVAHHRGEPARPGPVAVGGA